MFEVEKPLTTLGLGVDTLPKDAVKSGVFSGNDLGILGNIEQLPTEEEIENFVANSSKMQDWLQAKNRLEIYHFAKQFIADQQVLEAWKAILSLEK